MAKELRCADLGMKCDFVAKATTEDEVLAKAATHAQRVHHMSKIEGPMMERVKAAIRTV
ncbi:MAG TPA: DUF1059 domain-containing protein [Anaeromyxobacteraceae bacterium]|nr:DUF1059 domain-containing protein [Anaeromyxobacteraceae bacterium]